jgi:small subunit ribosomal protein S20
VETACRRTGITARVQDGPDGGKTVANTKSAEKRWRQSLKRRLRNRIAVGAARSAVRDTLRSMNAGEPDAEKLKKAVRALDKAAEKGIIHKNNAARRKSRLMHQFAVAQAGGPTPAMAQSRGGSRRARLAGSRGARARTR